METGYDQLLKVMFVDDEEKTRKLLRVFVDWQSIGYEPVEDAASANQAKMCIRDSSCPVRHPERKSGRKSVKIIRFSINLFYSYRS